ncbi:MAG: hypothetical protein HY810_08055 [Candidatus Omnitrophica bacterium]|nr:hypothetical protein [Candidatus Omnitrophota bacterium]
MQKKPIDKKKEINKQFFLIAGPCVIESEKMCLEHAAFLKELSNKLQIPFVFKASYDKANRTYLICDMRSIPIMKQFGFPVIFDATHSVQLPGAGKGKSLGQRQFVQPLALSALAAGADGLFLEVHACPEKALCDGPNMLALKNLESFLKKAKKIWEIINA